VPIPAVVGLAEPLSPELVLVCPELREHALAAAPPLPWETLGTWRADRVRPLGAGAQNVRRFPHRARDALLYVGGIAIPLVIIGIVVSLLTLVLTALAGTR
jgi:hypothetical protein